MGSESDVLNSYIFLVCEYFQQRQQAMAIAQIYKEIRHQRHIPFAQM